MNFRFFDDLVGSASGASQEYRFRERKHSLKNYWTKTIESFLDNLHTILKISKIFQKIFSKIYEKLKTNLRNLKIVLLIFKFFSDNVERFLKITNVNVFWKKFVKIWTNCKYFIKDLNIC